MPKFRKKPVEIEAEQWLGNDTQYHPGVEVDANGPFVTTIHEQRAYLAPGDWIIPEPKSGRYYPCKPDIFAATYDEI